MNAQNKMNYEKFEKCIETLEQVQARHNFLDFKKFPTTPGSLALCFMGSRKIIRHWCFSKPTAIITPPKSVLPDIIEFTFSLLKTLSRFDVCVQFGLIPQREHS